LRDARTSAIARRQLSAEANDYAVLAMNAANSKTLPVEFADCGTVVRDAALFLSHLDALV
jgi:hypothetical protein